MMFYIFLIAMLNLGLGFAAAMQLGRRYNALAVVSPSVDSVATAKPPDGDAENDSTESPIDLGMDADAHAPEEGDDSHENEPAEDTLEATAADSPDIDSDDVDSDDVDSEDSTEQPRDTDPDEFETDLDKLFEDVDT